MDIFYIYTIRYCHILELNNLKKKKIVEIHLPYADLIGECCPLVDEEDLLLVLILFRPGGI
jgi:hypothetical protein